MDLAMHHCSRTSRSVWSTSSLLALSEGGKREQAPRTPYASRPRRRSKIVAASEQVVELQPPLSSVTLSHQKIERTQDGDHVADHVAGKKPRQNPQIDKRR